ncbi:MAG: V-type ATP synthase subunit A, partial [Nitrospinota bacterium]
ALMADSTSRWAEAMREISGRLEEMPGEEGYPAYLGTRIASFYERSGRVTCLGREDREGSLSIIGAVSPPGGDLSEPVTQNTLRTVQVFWGLEDRLANMRHFPAINWLLSYSQYIPHLTDFLRERLDENFPLWRTQALALLTKEAELEEIVRLVGIDALSPSDRLVMETAKSLREDFLHQNAFHEEDTYTSLPKQAAMLHLILKLHERAQSMLDEGATIEQVVALPVRERIARAKYVPEAEAAKVFEEIERDIETETALAEVREGA